MSTSIHIQTDEQAHLRTTARAFLARHAPALDVRIWDEEGTYPEQLYREIARLGWYDVVASDEAVEGTAGLLTTLCEEIGRASSDLVALFNLNLSGLRDIHRWGTPEQQETYGAPVLAGEARLSIAVSEPDVGSDAASVATRADRLGDGWVLNGQKTYCEGAGLPGAVMELVARVGGGGRKRDQLGIFLVPVDHPGVEVRRMPALGRNISGIYEVFFDAGLPCEVESTMAKFLSGQLYAEASALAMQIQGAYGYVRDHALPMHHSDGIIARVVAGPPSVQLDFIARSMGLGTGTNR
ncbi:MAG: acyl-CoA dehydrogenase [Rhodococcus sp. (in: high G+C Gram-positive bacteria)]|nr:MAG: acyl-CoA dehydrogenase [Rhodococcus sp. (in: high G+C Gram-positive bacteria)]